MANNFEFTFTAEGFKLPSTGYPVRGNLQGNPFIGFAAATVNTARSIKTDVPAGYTGSGTLKARIKYFMDTGNTGKVDFEVSVEAITAGDAVDLNAAESFDTANAGNQTVPATAGYEGSLVITLTNKDSMAVGDSFRIKLERDADDGTDDTAAGVARVTHVTIYEEA